LISRQAIALFSLLAYAGLLLFGLWLAPAPWELETLLRLRGDAWQLQIRDHVAVWFWVGGVVNLSVLLVLALTTRWWVGRPPPPAEVPPTEEKLLPIRTKRWLWAAALVSMLAGGLVAWQRIDQSLWGDEDYTLRFHLHGHFKRDYQQPGFEEDGKVYFNNLSWFDTLFGYRTTNNHFLYTIVGRATLMAWQKKEGLLPEGETLLRPQFSERVLRVWPFAAGVLGIGAWIWLAVRFGLTSCAFGLALILPFHPWYSRFIAEARGYAFVFLLLPLMVIALVGALKRGRWRDWLAFGVCQVLMLYSWPGLVLQVAGLNLVAMIALLFQPSDQAASGFLERRPSINRWAIVCLLGALLIGQFVAPGVPQVQGYLEKDSLDIPVWYEGMKFEEQPWLQNVAGLLAIGTEWRDSYGDGVTNPLYVIVERLKETPGRAQIIPFFLGFYLFAALGVLYFIGKVRHGWLYAVAFIGPILFFYCVLGHARGKYLFYWYFVYAVPILLIFALCGVTWVFGSLGALLGRRKGEKFLSGTGVLFLAALLCWFAWPKLAVMHHHSVNPLRESVDATRPGYDYRNPDAPERWGTITAHAHMGAFCYDPQGYNVEATFSKIPQIPGLTRLMRQADEGRIPLLVNLGYPSDARLHRPDLLKILDDEELFEKVETFWGLEPQHTREIFRYRGGFFSALAPRGTPRPLPEESEAPAE